MPKITLWIILFVTAIFSLSCNETTTTPSEPQKPVLTASENPVTVARNYTKDIIVTGGKGSYHVKSMTDSTIVQVNIFTLNRGSAQVYQDVSFLGKNIGTTKVIIQDSAKTAEVEIIVTVAVMASSPSTISVKTEQSKYVYISGGTYPYKIDQTPNPAIATVTQNGSSLQVTGVSQGSTSVTVSDNANPANVLTIPITVVIPPSFTTAGKISFTSTIGNFETEGIYGAKNLNDLPSNDAGAGGFIMKYSFVGNVGEVVGYKKKTSSLMDIVLFVFYKNELTPGSVSLDSGYSNLQREMGSMIFGFDLVPYGTTNTMYSTFSGSISFTTLNEQKAEGSFSGNASRLSNQSGTPIPGSDVTISQGLFSIPIIVDVGSYTSVTKEEQAIFNQLERMAKPYVDKMRNKIEARQKKLMRQ